MRLQCESDESCGVAHVINDEDALHGRPLFLNGRVLRVTKLYVAFFRRWRRACMLRPAQDSWSRGVKCSRSATEDENDRGTGRLVRAASHGSRQHVAFHAKYSF